MPLKAHFTLGVKAERERERKKKLFNLPQVTNKCWTLWPCIGPKAQKRIPSNLGGQFATLGANVPTPISKLGANLQLKNAQSWPQAFFGPNS